MKIRLINIPFYQNQEPNSEQAGTLDIIGGNLFPNTGKLPGTEDRCVNFRYTYSDTYDYTSEGNVNTHFDYPFGGKYTNTQSEGCNRIFVKLGFWQRWKFYYIMKQSWLHKHPIASLALIVNLLVGIINVIVGILNYQNSH